MWERKLNGCYVNVHVDEAVGANIFEVDVHV